MSPRRPQAPALPCTMVLLAALALAALAALAACGKRNQDEAPDPAHLPQLPAIDDSCDPRKARVCVGSDVVVCEQGKLGRHLRVCHDGCVDGACAHSCGADGVELIYVVDSDNNLRSFDPRKLPGDPFKLVGRLTCEPYGAPYSMAADRDATAWVEYQDGQMFQVSITDASCKPSAYQNDALGTTYGMGFVTDAPGSTNETLFLAINDDSHGLVSVDTKQRAPRPRKLGTIAATEYMNAELTGTSEAKLFGFYPMTNEPSFVQEIDRQTGAALGPRWPLGAAPLGAVSAYAFAQWGGVFYVFATTNGNSTVRAVNRKTGEYRTVLEDLPFRITGAGVSTCAPERDGQ